MSHWVEGAFLAACILIGVGLFAGAVWLVNRWFPFPIGKGSPRRKDKD